MATTFYAGRFVDNYKEIERVKFIASSSCSKNIILFGDLEKKLLNFSECWIEFFGAEGRNTSVGFDSRSRRFGCVIDATRSFLQQGGFHAFGVGSFCADFAANRFASSIDAETAEAMEWKTGARAWFRTCYL